MIHAVLTAVAIVAAVCCMDHERLWPAWRQEDYYENNIRHINVYGAGFGLVLVSVWMFATMNWTILNMLVLAIATGMILGRIYRMAGVHIPRLPRASKERLERSQP